MCLFDDVGTTSDNVSSNVTVMHEWAGIWKEAIMTTLKVLSRHLSGENEKKYDNSESLFRCRGWDLILGPIKHEGVVALSTRALCIGVRDVMRICWCRIRC